MSKFVVLTAMIIVYVIYGLYLAQYNVAILGDDLVAENPRGFLDYRGITHVHADDRGAAITAAQGAGLDFLSLTEVNAFENSGEKRPDSTAGYHGNLLVTMDGEYSYLNSRLLNLGATTTRHLQGLGRSQVIFADILSRRAREADLGVFVLAHAPKDLYRWSGEYPEGLDGLEIINLKDLWKQAWTRQRWSFAMTILMFPFNERLALLRLFKAPDEEWHLLDTLAQRRPTLALAGAGAEAGFRFPTYDTIFSIVRDHVLLRSELTGNTKSDLEKLNGAIRQGQFYMSLDILGNPKGFNAVMRESSGQILPMGASLAYRDGLTLEVTLPQKPKVPFDTIIYRNGERVMTSNSTVTEYAVSTPGVYRVMVRVIPTLPLPDGKKWIPWIYTNSFYVLERSSARVSGMRTTRPGRGGS